MTDEKKDPIQSEDDAMKLAEAVKDALFGLGFTAFIVAGCISDSNKLAVILKCSPIEGIVLDDALHENITKQFIGPGIEKLDDLMQSLNEAAKKKCDSCQKKKECDAANVASVSDCGHA